MKELAGLTALVTGASRGIGPEIATRQDRSEFDPSDMLSPASIAGTIRGIVETPLDVRIHEMFILPPKGIL